MRNLSCLYQNLYPLKHLYEKDLLPLPFSYIIGGSTRVKADVDQGKGRGRSGHEERSAGAWKGSVEPPSRQGDRISIESALRHFFSHLILAMTPIVISIENWGDADSLTLPESCLIRFSLSDEHHSEKFEISISTLEVDHGKFVDCRSRSWPCCPHSDLVVPQDRIRGFYLQRFPVGGFIDHGQVARHSAARDDRRFVARMIQKVEQGSRLALTGATKQAGEQAGELRSAIMQYRDGISATQDFEYRLDGLSRLLQNIEGQIRAMKSEAMNGLHWRVRFLSDCVGVVKRNRCALKNPEDIDQAEYQRRRRASAKMLNRIVSGLVPRLGAYALVLYSALEVSEFSWARLAKRSERRRQEVIEVVTKQVLDIEFHAQQEQCWFNPAAVIAWLMKTRYSHVCELIELDALAVPIESLNIPEGNPACHFMLPLSWLFDMHPASPGRKTASIGDVVVINPDPSLILDQTNHHRPQTPRKRVHASDTPLVADSSRALGSTSSRPPSTNISTATEPPEGPCRKRRRKIHAKTDRAADVPSADREETFDNNVLYIMQAGR